LGFQVGKAVFLPFTPASQAERVWAFKLAKPPFSPSLPLRMGMSLPASPAHRSRFGYHSRFARERVCLHRLLIAAVLAITPASHGNEFGLPSRQSRLSALHSRFANKKEALRLC